MPEHTAPEIESRVRDRLEDVQYTDQNETVSASDVVERIDVDDGRVTIGITPQTSDDIHPDDLLERLVETATSVEGVESAHVEPATTPSDTTDVDRSVGVSSFDHVVAVASTKGGVGKSTVATNLACALAATDAEVGLFDADIYGPNVPALLEVDEPIRSTADDNAKPVRKDGLEVISVALMSQGGPLAWRGAMAHDALTELFEETAWAADDVLVVDLPPGTGDTVLTTLQEVPIDGVVFVTTPFHTSVEDTERSLELFGENDVPVLGLVENMEAFTCPSCGDTHPMFPDDEETGDLDVPVLASLPFSPKLQESPSPTDPHEEFVALAEAVRDRVETVWTVDVPDDAVDLRDVPPDHRHEAVREGFRPLAAGEEFVLVSDRDPTPVREYLADLAGVSPAEFDVTVERATPETWVLRTERP